MSAAASVIGANVATVSRRIHKLSEELGNPLFTKKGVIWSATPFAMGMIRWAEKTEWHLAEMVEAATSDQLNVSIRVDPNLRGSAMLAEIGAMVAKRQDISLTLSCLEQPSEVGDLNCTLTSLPITTVGETQISVGHMRRAVWCGANFQGRPQGWVRIAGSHQEDRASAAMIEAFGEARIVTHDVNSVLETVCHAPLVGVFPMDLALRHRGLRLMKSFPVIEEEIFLIVPVGQEAHPVVGALVAAARTGLTREENALVLPKLSLVSAL